MIFSEAIELFLGQYKPSTRRTYGDDLKSLTRYIAPGLPLTEIKFAEVERAVQQYEQRSTVNSVYTVNKFIRTTKRFFNWCVQIEELQKSPAALVLFRPEPKNDVLERTMPNQTYEALIDYYTLAAQLNPRNLRFLSLLHFLGSSARRRGCAYLRWSDIDLDKREAVIYDKADVHRVVFISPEAAAVMRRWHLVQKATEGDYVFTVKGGPINPHALGKFFRDWCAKAGFNKPVAPGEKPVRGWGIHSVRHNVGIYLQDSGVNEIDAAGVMGHTVQTYRNSYAAHDIERRRAAARKMHTRRSAQRKQPPAPAIRPFKDETG